MRGPRLFGVALAVLGLALLTAHTPSEGLPALPGGWPTTLQLGVSDGPGGAAQLRATTGAGLRYQYLGGGANTGSGWATWNSNGSFVTMYIQESVQQGMIPVFSYYMIGQSAPGNAQGEPAGSFTNLQTTATMQAYYEDLKLFFQRAGAFPGSRVVLHVEPDLWGYMQQQRAVGDDGASVPVRVAATGLPELAGLPDNAAGLAQAIAGLRDRYAPNVVLAYHLNIWGTNFNLSVSDPPVATVDAHATRAAAFFNSLNGRFDLVFGEFSDRDAGYYQHVVGDGGAAWWDAGDFPRFARFLGTFVGLAGKRVVLWQIPLGNTRMRAVNNTWHHYQDNRVEWFLDDPSRAHLAEYVQAGVVAFLFGRGSDGNTCACDASGDGTTNPAPINGNTRVSLNADDDGGFFRERTAAYYAAGALSLEGGAPSPPPPPAPGPTPTFTLTVVRAGTGSGSVMSAPAGVACGTDCSEAYASGTGVTLTATAAAGSVFGGWSDAGCSGTGGCTLAMTANRSVTATFSAQTTGPPSFAVTGTTASPDPVAPGAATTITTSVTNTGGAASGILVDMEVYDAGGTKIHQQFVTGQSFQGGQQKTFQWTWPVPASQSPGAYTVKIGIFSGDWATLYDWQNNAGTVSVQSGGSPTFTLAVSRAGTGGGTVTSAPAGVACGSDCSEAYASGTGVTLTATAAAGSVFGGWSGAGCSGTGACTVAMTANRSVTATFSAQAAGPPSFTVTGTAASPNPVSRGTSTIITTSVTNGGGAASGMLVDMEVYNAGGTKIHQQFATGQSFQGGQQKTFQWTWPVPATQSPGVYTVKIGIFSSDWATLYTWHNAAASVTVP